MPQHMILLLVLRDFRLKRVPFCHLSIERASVSFWGQPKLANTQLGVYADFTSLWVRVD